MISGKRNERGFVEMDLSFFKDHSINVVIFATMYPTEGEKNVEGGSYVPKCIVHINFVIRKS